MEYRQRDLYAKGLSEGCSRLATAIALVYIVGVGERKLARIVSAKQASATRRVSPIEIEAV